MRKIICLFCILVAFDSFSELPVLRTRFRKALIKTVAEYAVQGDSEAQMELALRCYAGHQVTQSADKAFEWMMRAAEQNDAAAQYLLSLMYSEGIGTAVDVVKSEQWFAKAIARSPDDEQMVAQYEKYLADKDGDPDALTRFRRACSDAGYIPAFVECRLPEALELYNSGQYGVAARLLCQLVDANDPTASFYYGKMYEEGLGGLPKNYVEAFDLYFRAAAGGVADAQYALASMYEFGKGTQKDLEKADLWYEQAANGGCRDAGCKFADFEFADAVSMLEQASSPVVDEEQQAAFERAYRQKIGNAVAWYRKAASHSSPEALYAMGRLCASGEGVRKNLNEAARFFEQAAENGHVDALFYRGLMYQAGLGGSHDDAKAVQLYEQAAELGSRAAMFYLGNCYCCGAGVEQNALKGESYYFQKVLDGVDPEAIEKEQTDLVFEEVPELMQDPWILRGAREYGVALWCRAVSDREFDEARRWIGLAARYGDAGARDTLVRLATRDRQSYDDESLEALRDKIAVSAADPGKDALAPLRKTGFLYPYLTKNVKDLYAKSRAKEAIADVQIRKQRNQDVAGDDLWELYVKYRRPASRDAVGFNGVLLMGVEFEDGDTGERYWVFDQSADDVTSFTGGAYTDVSLFVNLNRYPNARMSSWAVVYGHLLDDNITLAVFDAREKAERLGNLEQLAFKNQFSTKLDSKVVATVDIYSMLRGTAASVDPGVLPEGESAPVESSSADVFGD